MDREGWKERETRDKKRGNRAAQPETPYVINADGTPDTRGPLKVSYLPRMLPQAHLGTSNRAHLKDYPFCKASLLHAATSTFQPPPPSTLKTT